MKKAVLTSSVLTLFLILGVGVGLASVKTVDLSHLETTESVSPTSSISLDLGFEPFGEVDTAHHRPLCVEPDPCETSADCGVTVEGYNGVCLQGSCYCP